MIDEPDSMSNERSVPVAAKDYLEIVLVPEPESRFDIAKDESSPDRLCRVIVGVTGDLRPATDLEVAMRGDPPPNYPQSLGLAAAYLAGPAARIWTVGTMRPSRAQIARKEKSATVSIVSQPHANDLVIFRLTSGDVRIDTIWPGYGCYTFCFNTENTPLERLPIQMEEAVRNDPVEAVALERQMERRCNHREGAREACADSDICIFPDGPHDTHFAFHSSRVAVDRIVEAIRNVAESNGMGLRFLGSAAEFVKLFR